MTADLVDFLRARLADDERTAQACEKEVGTHRAGEMYDDGSGTADYDAFPSYPWGQMDAELAYMAGPGHPARVLREVAAKRAILDMVNSPGRMTLRWLAAVYADHPEYRDEWAI